MSFLQNADPRGLGSPLFALASPKSAVARPGEIDKEKSVDLRFLSPGSLRPKGIWRKNAGKIA
jgi:hypothetical protein